MDWIQSMQKAINYMEDNLLEDLCCEDVAKSVYSSSAHFQRIFSIVTGITVSDYIRFRRLALAGQELARNEAKAIDVALKYGYDTPESFSKAFARFHGFTPLDARKPGAGLKRFEPLLIQVQIKGGFDMARKLIPNVPLISISADNYSYLTSFVGALYGALKGVGEGVGSAELLACSGLGNRLCWTKGKWLFGNEDIENYNEEPFGIQSRLLNLFGWRVNRVVVERDNQGGTADPPEAQIRRNFVESLDRGFPVLAQGITDDGCKHDYDVFFGYEDDGRKLIGWDYYQQGSEPFVREGWERELCSYVLLEEKVEPVPERSRAIEAFRAVVRNARDGELRGRQLGLMAWVALMDQLEQDDFTVCTVHPANGVTPPGASADSLEHRFIIYCDALCQISQRGQILPYYEALASRYPEWSRNLKEAIAAWKDCSDYGGYLWSLGLSFTDGGFEKFRSPQVRKALADEGRRAMARDAFAVERIEELLLAEGRLPEENTGT